MEKMIKNRHIYWRNQEGKGQLPLTLYLIYVYIVMVYFINIKLYMYMNMNIYLITPPGSGYTTTYTIISKIDQNIRITYNL